MIVCVCNNISEKDLEKNPELINIVGSKCGICVRDKNIDINTSRNKPNYRVVNGTTNLPSNVLPN